MFIRTLVLNSILATDIPGNAPSSVDHHQSLSTSAMSSLSYDQDQLVRDRILYSTSTVDVTAISRVVCREPELVEHSPYGRVREPKLVIQSGSALRLARLL